MKVKCWRSAIYLLVISVLLSGCIFSSESQQARQAAEKFWQAVLNEDMDTAKALATWESASYLQYLNSERIAAQRFETGEIRLEGIQAEVATLLHGGEKGDMTIPLRTVMVRNKEEWRVDVQETMGSMVSGAMGAVADQLSTFMEEGLKELDKALADSVSELNRNLKQGIEQLEKDLATPPLSPGNPEQPDGQEPPPGAQAI